MGSLYSEAGYKQKIAVLEEKKNLLVRQLRKKDMMCRFLEKEKGKRDSRTMFQEFSFRVKKKGRDSELTGPYGENLTWIIHIDSPDTTEMCLSFCRHHPVFSGKIIIADSLLMPEISSEIDRILSKYKKSKRRRLSGRILFSCKFSDRSDRDGMDPVSRFLGACKRTFCRRDMR